MPTFAILVESARDPPEPVLEPAVVEQTCGEETAREHRQLDPEELGRPLPVQSSVLGDQQLEGADVPDPGRPGLEREVADEQRRQHEPSEPAQEGEDEPDGEHDGGCDRQHRQLHRQRLEVERAIQRVPREQVLHQRDADEEHRVDHQDCDRSANLGEELGRPGDREPIEELEGSLVVLADEEAPRHAERDEEHDGAVAAVGELARPDEPERALVGKDEEDELHEIDNAEEDPKRHEGPLVPQLLAYEREGHGTSIR